MYCHHARTQQRRGRLMATTSIEWTRAAVDALQAAGYIIAREATPAAESGGPHGP